MRRVRLVCHLNVWVHVRDMPETKCTHRPGSLGNQGMGAPKMSETICKCKADEGNTQPENGWGHTGRPLSGSPSRTLAYALGVERMALEPSAKSGDDR